MAEGDQTPGGQGGGRTYSEEDVMTLMNEAAKRAASEAVKKAAKDEEDDEGVSVINPKVVKQLKDTVAVFTALKELSSNPLQKTIEETVGGMAASVVQNAFAPRGPPPKKDIVDTLLNSQFAFGLGSGLGQRAPELVETMGRTFGTDKAGQMMDNIIGKYGSGGGQGGQSRQISSGSPGGSTGTSTPSTPPPEQKADKQSEKELLLSLDPNNPEHVSAYAETQGGLPVDVARKMLMIHQDAFIEQLKKDGMNVDQISTQRGSHTSTDIGKSAPTPTQQTGTPATPVSPPPRQDTPPTYPNSYPTEQPSPQPPDDIEYAEYNDIAQPGQHPGPQPNSIPNGQDGQQVEMMKTFATDVGKVMGEMLNKIESLNNTVFTMQNEMNDMKKQGTIQQPPLGMFPKMPSHIAESPPGIVRTPPDIVHPITGYPVPIGTPSLETFEDKVFEDQIESPKAELNIERSEDFFEEDIVDINSTPSPGTVQLPVQPIPPLVVQHTPPSIPPLVVQHTPPPVVQPIPPPLSTVTTRQVQPVESAVSTPFPIEEKEEKKKEKIEKIEKEEEKKKEKIEKIEKEEEKKKEKIEKIEKEEESRPKDRDINYVNKIPIIPDEKTSEDKTFEDNNNDKFITPIKKVGVHKKATFRNLKPSFQKNDNKENI